MKCNLKLLCSICLLVIGTSCKQKIAFVQNETKLINELINLESLQENNPSEIASGTYLIIPEEPRKPSPKHPLIVLDILNARSNVRDIKISDLYSEIKYVPIKFPGSGDSVMSMFGEYNFLVTPNNIIASHYTHGISQFDINGNFVNQIVKNDFYFTAIPNRKSYMISADDRRQFVGNSGQVHAIGDMIYYQYHNNPDGKGAMMQFDTNPKTLSPIMIDYSENPIGVPKGSELFSFPMNNPKSGAISSIMSPNMIPINDEEWATSRSVMRSAKSGHFLYSTTLSGDTLTKFKNHDPVVNFSGGLYRSIDSQGDQYSFLDQQYVRQAHNDTIYILAQASRLIPKYVLDFGDRGIQSTLEGIDPRISLKDKFIIGEFVECNKYLFITYTQNTPSPNSAKKKAVLYNACIYVKSTRELFHIYIDQPPYIPEGRSWPRQPINYLVNNQDDSPAFWPKKATHDGKPFTWIKNNSAFNYLDHQEADYLLMIGY